MRVVAAVVIAAVAMCEGAYIKDTAQQQLLLLCKGLVEDDGGL